MDLILSLLRVFFLENAITYSEVKFFLRLQGN